MTVKRKGMAATKVLVKWKHNLPEDATWEFYYDFKRKYPSFHFLGQECIHGRGIVTYKVIFRCKSERLV